jgi:hypothetical protein
MRVKSYFCVSKMLQRRRHVEMFQTFLAFVWVLSFGGILFYHEWSTICFTSPYLMVPKQSIVALGEWSDLLITHRLRSNLLSLDESMHVRVLFTTTEQQRKFLLMSHSELIPHFDALVQAQHLHLATLLWQFAKAAESTDDIVVLIDTKVPTFFDWAPMLTENEKINHAILSDYNTASPSSVLTSFLVLQRQGRESLMQSMSRKMLEMSIDTLVSTHTGGSSSENTGTGVMSDVPIHQTLSYHLYDIIAQQMESEVRPAAGMLGKWMFYKQDCSFDTMVGSYPSLQLWKHKNNASGEGGDGGGSGSSGVNDIGLSHVCSVMDPITSKVMMLVNNEGPVRSRLYGTITREQTHRNNYKLQRSDNNEHDNEIMDYMARISTKVQEELNAMPSVLSIYDKLKQKKCLPSKQCINCLMRRKHLDFTKCLRFSPCFHEHICNETQHAKPVTMKLTVHPPPSNHRSTHLIPRIVHQTWFEEVDKESYPNLSRMVQSFNQSGWQHRFYSDDQARNFIISHFPSPVQQAYDALIPGSLKADLFRYCVLLIYGGVYADVDIMLESNLDVIITPDVSFMIPIDEPGNKVDRRMCLWNGFMASAPGHPFLAKAIETVVNQVRNRFTSVDVDATFCPDPPFSMLHLYDTLYTAGPCLLGASVNRVLGRSPIASFHAGDLDVASYNMNIRGRTILLYQGKQDMGAHRFTDIDQNLVVCATDLPDAENGIKSNLTLTRPVRHYTTLQGKRIIYGLEGLYVNDIRANEDIRIVVDMSS